MYLQGQAAIDGCVLDHNFGRRYLKSSRFRNQVVCRPPPSFFWGGWGSGLWSLSAANPWKRQRPDPGLSFAERTVKGIAWGPKGVQARDENQTKQGTKPTMPPEAMYKLR